MCFIDFCSLPNFCLWLVGLEKIKVGFLISYLRACCLDTPSPSRTVMARDQKTAVFAAVLVVIILTASFLFLMPLCITENSDRPIRVACVGDSITQGTEYPKDLQQLLGSNYTVGNFGLGGSTVLLSSTKPYFYRPAFQNAISFHPDVVIIMLGTNDATPRFFGDIERFVGDYITLIEAFQGQTNQIWLVIPPPIFDDSLGPNSENFINGVLPRLQQVADDLKLPTVNVYPLLLDHPDYFWDGVHPDWQGSKVIANEVYRVVFGGTTQL